MSFTRGPGRAINGLSARGFCWAGGSAAICAAAGADLIITLIIAIIAYVKGA